MNMKKIGLFAAGVLFGTAGIKVLGSKDAKKAYAQTTAAALRAKDSVMTTVTATRRPKQSMTSARKQWLLLPWRMLLRKRRRTRQSNP